MITGNRKPGIQIKHSTKQQLFRFLNISFFFETFEIAKAIVNIIGIFTLFCLLWGISIENAHSTNQFCRNILWLHQYSLENRMQKKKFTLKLCLQFNFLYFAIVNLKKLKIIVSTIRICQCTPKLAAKQNYYFENQRILPPYGLIWIVERTVGIISIINISEMIINYENNNCNNYILNKNKSIQSSRSNLVWCRTINIQCSKKKIPFQSKNLLHGFQTWGETPLPSSFKITKN